MLASWNYDVVLEARSSRVMKGKVAFSGIQEGKWNICGIEPDDDYRLPC
jgi:hypothetical protein